MSKLIEVSQNQAIKIMEDNLKRIKKHFESETFLLLSYDLNRGILIERKKLNKEGGIKIIESCKSFILNDDTEIDKVCVLSMYTELQPDIYNIQLIGEKYDMIIVP